MSIKDWGIGFSLLKIISPSGGSASVRDVQVAISE